MDYVEILLGILMIIFRNPINKGMFRVSGGLAIGGTRVTLKEQMKVVWFCGFFLIFADCFSLIIK